MDPDTFWQQDRLLLSLELFAGLIALGFVVYAGLLAKRHLQKRGLDPHVLGRSLLLFRVGRWGLALAGLATLFITIAPGLTPLGGHIDQNLGLGGIVLFFLWPLIAAQIIMGVLPVGDKIHAKTPLLAWILLLAGYVVCISVDRAVIELLYN